MTCFFSPVIAIIAGSIGGILVIGGMIGICIWCMRSTNVNGGLAYQNGPLMGNNVIQPNNPNGRGIVVQSMNKQMAPPPPYRP